VSGAASHPAVAAVEMRLPAQVVTATHESGATVNYRLMDANITPTATRIVADLAWWMAENCPDRDGDFGVWRETDLRLLALKLHNDQDQIDAEARRA
jgi:hypothetical protein